MYPSIEMFQRAAEQGEIDVHVLERKFQSWLDQTSLPVPRDEAEQICRSLLWEDPPHTVESIKEWEPDIHHSLDELKYKEMIVIQTLSDHLPKLNQRLNHQMIKWCKLFLDRFQAIYQMPYREEGLFGAWRKMSRIDPALKKSERMRLAELPDDAEEALLHGLTSLGIEKTNWVEYLEAHLLELPGWAGMVKWQSQQEEAHHHLLLEYLAIRLSLEWAMIAPLLPLSPVKMTNKDDLCRALSAMIHYGNMSQTRWEKLTPHELTNQLIFYDYFIRIERNHLWQETWEDTYEAKIKQAITSNKNVQTKEPDAQFLFCIDVRSEPIRRQLEQEGPYETYGSAGFFGLPIRIREFESDQTHASCPAIVAPLHEIAEVADPNQMTKYLFRKNIWKLTNETFKKMKQNFLACLYLPEMSGLWLGLNSFVRSISPLKAGWLFHQAKEHKKKPVTHFTVDRSNDIGRSGLTVGFSQEEKVRYVKQLLISIGLTESFAPLVVVCGHESASENNPYASSLDCGACGGRAGAFNARLFATLCNLPEVREELNREGVHIPDETVFVAAEHITTTDEIRWLEVPSLSGKSQIAFERLEKVLPNMRKKAGAERSEQLTGLGKPLRNIELDLQRRAVDWSEIRPEWGLAGNAAFFIGNRERTKHCNLEGRVFLHSYDWEQDQAGTVLNDIINGPVTVGQWINLQYYASTVDPHYYGSGNKATQTVTAGIGMMHGNSSDLMIGLPLQSIAASDTRLFHSPLRLLLIIEAPESVIELLLSTNHVFKQKVKNGWIRLSSLDPLCKKWTKWDYTRV